MHLPEKWIWLPVDKYPDHQTTKYSGFLSGEESYCVAEFSKKYTFSKKIRSATLRFSGDTEFQLFCNGKILAAAPVTVEDDFIVNERPRNNFYATKMAIQPNSKTLDFFARVKLMPVKICEYSKGHGGFMLTAYIVFADGTKTIVCTDNSWQVRRNGAYFAPYCYGGRILPEPYVNAEEIDNIWHTTTAPLRVREEKQVAPVAGNRIYLRPGEEKEEVIYFDKIYAAFVHLCVKTEGQIEIELLARELDEEYGSRESFIFHNDDEYRGLQLHSAGNFVLKIKNLSSLAAEITVGFISTYYPIDNVAKMVTDDGDINKILEVCRHTLKYCRQLHHLDSPRHCEPLACTGDYYIESLMTAFSFGDMSLAEFDVLRTAELLRNNDGRMFHTTYSLIWVRMLYDVYMFTGNVCLLEKCADALILLLKRFETYLGRNGIIETPPDYMFVDWIYIDEISMHHPPKALGQTCLNMFYFGALDYAAKVFDALRDKAMAEDCIAKREKLRTAINENLFSKKKGLYFEGKNTKTPEELIGQYMPQNVRKRYYLKHSNILAAYFGVCDEETAKDLIEKVMTEKCPGGYQPYFAHFLLEAIYKNGFREKYTLDVIEKWKKPVADCPKGLVEGFIVPEPTYSFDHSHAWGGTPLYSLPKAILGFEIKKPGLLEIELNPSLLGLKKATIEIPTPYGKIVCKLNEGMKPIIKAPAEVTVCFKKDELC